ncbi:YncE family protein [Pontibacter burrus]|uniref:Uncharacterized protein n=1 Tax=Pontibacter burrus TaxID=2704466 RepID=A0A6B3LPR8_9BACT|nr:hypothetical protein [Pontibacter burrus]NEM96166.1 hypothetical protein [Pontibacter burrus]
MIGGYYQSVLKKQTPVGFGAQIIHTFPSGGDYRGLEYIGEVLVAVDTTGKLHRYDVNTRQALDVISVGGAPHWVKMLGDELCIGNYASAAKVSVLHPATFAVTRQFGSVNFSQDAVYRTGRYYIASNFNPYGARVYDAAGVLTADLNQSNTSQTTCLSIVGDTIYFSIGPLFLPYHIPTGQFGNSLTFFNKGGGIYGVQGRHAWGVNGLILFAMRGVNPGLKLFSANRVLLDEKVSEPMFGVIFRGKEFYALSQAGNLYKVTIRYA